MSQRFFVESPITGSVATLQGPESHHLVHVMRAAVGDKVILFDGGGGEFAAQVARIGRAEVELSVLARVDVDRELARPLVLGVPLPKGDRQKWLIEKAVEVGVSELVPLVTARGVAQPVEQAIERLKRSVIEASKQCGRNRLMQIGAQQTWSAYIAAAPAECGRFFAHPQSRPSVIQPAVAGSLYLAVGPEGGLTDEEVALATEAGWRAVDLGPRILRVETAALWLAAQVTLNL